jgi:hypothetical protein
MWHGVPKTPASWHLAQPQIRTRCKGYRDWLLSGCRRITLSVRAAAEVMPMRAIGQHSYTLGSITEILIKDDQALVQ